MELLTVNLVANQTQQFVKPGRYFEIIDSAYPLNVDFTGPAGNMSDNIRGALSGLFVEGAYAHFALTSVSTQTVTLLLMENGKGGSRRQPGIVSVVNKVGAGVQATSGASTLAVGSFADLVMSAASNPRGAIIRHAAISAVQTAGGTSTVRMIAAPVAPASQIPASSYQLAGLFVTGAQSLNTVKDDLTILIPANWGIWTYSVTLVNPASTSGWELTYEPQ